MLKLGFIFAALCAFAPSAAYASTVDDSRIVLKIFNCADQLNEYPSILVSRTYEIGSYHSLTTKVERGSEGIYFARLAPLAQHFWISVRSGRCYANIPIAVIPGHNRSQLVFPSDKRVAAIDARHWIAGKLPRGVGKVTLTALSGRTYDSAVIDDGCFYFEYVGTGKYLVRFEVSAGLFVYLSADIVGNGDSGMVVNLDDHDIINVLVKGPSPAPSVAP